MSRSDMMPLWTDVYLGDTRHLSTEQNGAYLLMLITSWRSGKCALPDDDARMARITGLSKAKWLRHKPVLIEFFTLENGQFTQKRLKQEWQNRQDYIAAQSEKGKKSARKRAKISRENDEEKKQKQKPKSLKNNQSDLTGVGTGHPTEIQPAVAVADIIDDEDAGARDWKQIHKACLEAADPCLDQSAKMLMNFSKLRHWLEADPPCDLERDIIPTLNHVANRSKKQDVRSWNYFQRAIFDARDERLNTDHESSQKGNRNAGNYNGRSNGATSRDNRKANTVSWEKAFADVLLDRENKSR